MIYLEVNNLKESLLKDLTSVSKIIGLCDNKLGLTGEESLRAMYLLSGRSYKTIALADGVCPEAVVTSLRRARLKALKYIGTIIT
jgi:hypothetical protein